MTPRPVHPPARAEEPAQAPTVLVLGARGRLGLAAARAFAQAGWQVVAQVRPSAARCTLPAIHGVWWSHVPLADTQALAEQARGAQVVVHALNPRYTDRAWAQQTPALTDGAIAVARALNATLMLPGNVYNFGANMPPVLREDTPQAPTCTKGRLRVELEQRLCTATLDGQMRAVVVRAGDFFGSGSGGLLDRVLAKDLARGRVMVPGPEGVATPWAYLPDLARTLVRVAEQRARLPAFACLHFAGHQASAERWVRCLSAVAAEQGWVPTDGAVRVGRLPWALLRLAGLLVPTLRSMAAMRYLWRTPHQLDNARLRALIGEEPHTPFDTAVRQSLADLGMLSAPASGPALA